MKVLFLGYGNMGRALGEAWRDSGRVQTLLAIDPAPLPEGAAPVPGRHASVQSLQSAGDAAGGVDLVVVAVKPAMAADALRVLPADWLAQAVVVSVAAGVTVATLEAALPLGTPVIRVMPNTPAMLRAGCTGLYAAPGVDEARREQVGALFATVGSAHWVDQESHIDLVTAFSGSGPAYYHLFSEALAQAGVALGLSPELARALAADTAWGAAALQHQPDADFAALRRAVTSPNGTTAAAIAVFEEGEALRALVKKAAEAAHRRAVELSAGG